MVGVLIILVGVIWLIGGEYLMVREANRTEALARSKEGNEST